MVAIVSYIRSAPDVTRPNGPMEIGVLAKILDRRDELVVDVARRIDHDAIELAPPPTPTAEYGRFVVRTCTGCTARV